MAPPVRFRGEQQINKGLTPRSLVGTVVCRQPRGWPILLNLDFGVGIEGVGAQRKGV
jgi:hypothetical protein